MEKKTSTNPYKAARLRKAERDLTFKTSEYVAQSVLYMARERLQKIEQDDPKKQQTDPSPDEVIAMAKAYDAPELLDHYCSRQCPIGMGREPLEHDNIYKIGFSLVTSINKLQEAAIDISNILDDGSISDDEKREFGEILRVLQDFTHSAQSIELWAKKNKIIASGLK